MKPRYTNKIQKKILNRFSSNKNIKQKRIVRPESPYRSVLRPNFKKVRNKTSYSMKRIRKIYKR